jgi:hypothetical protein
MADRHDYEGRVAVSDAERGWYNLEHTFAYLMAVTAIVLGVIGLLRGFGIVGGEESLNAAVNSDSVERATDAISGPGSAWDGAVWLLPAIAAAMLSFALHRGDHHTAGYVAEHDGTWKGEHFVAWLLALGTIAAGVVAILVGFDVFDRGNSQLDGLLWGLASIGGGILVNTLHDVRHHLVVADEDYIMAVVERRARISQPVIRTEESAEHHA